MNELTKYLVDGILKEVDDGITVMLPGGFKPPHQGHLMLAKGYAELPQVKNVVILIGPKDRDGITVEDSEAIWKMLIGSTPNITVQRSKYPSPLLTAYKYVEEDAEAGQAYALGSSSKGDDYDRIRGFVDGHQEGGKYYKQGVSVVELPLEMSKPIIYKGRTDDQNGKPMSASQLRADLAANDFENFKTNYPSITSQQQLQTIFDMLIKKKMKENITGLSLSTLDEDATQLIRKQFEGLKNKFGAFIDKLKQENRETKESFQKLVNAVKTGERLDKSEKKEIGDQMKDVLKLAGYTAASVLPGGIVYLLLTRVPALKKHMTPSAFLKEDINLPVNIGDTILMGKFKNKKVVVKSVSKNEKGDLQINGRPALKFRIPKKKVDEVQKGNNTYGLINEGGAAGHMAHPYEDVDLTFDDIDNMIDAALSGKVEYAQEKLDGQNLMVTYKDGRVLSARNKGQLKNAAENAMSKADMEKSMEHLPDNVRNAFLDAMQDISDAIDKLTPAEKEEFFGNGIKFINMELLHPASENVAAYGVTQLRMHNVQEYDQAGNVINTDSQAPKKIEQALNQVEASKQGTYEIRATDIVNLKQTEDYEKQKQELTNALDAIRNKYRLSKGDKLGLYFQNNWSNFIQQNAKKYNYNIPDNVLQNIVNRWAFASKDPDLRALKASIDNPQFLQWFTDMDKGAGVREQKKVIVEPVEDIFLKLGVFVLKSIQGLLAINPNASISKMKDELTSSIQQIKAKASNNNMSDDDAPMRFLKHQLKRLEKIGGFDAILPTEGVVFKHKGKLYKLTGAFAPVNQIIGYIKFGR